MQPAGVKHGSIRIEPNTRPKTTLPASLLSQVRNRSGKAVDLVIFTANTAGLGSYENPDPGGATPGFTNFVLTQHDRLGFAVDVDADAFFAAAIDDAVSL